MGVVGQRIQKKVRQAVSRQMVLNGNTFGKDQARRIDTARGSLPPQVRLCRFPVAIEPEHTAFDLAQAAASTCRTRAA